jgi:lysozyme
VKISSKGIHLIKKWEGFKNTAYKCPADKLTIGYGHVILAKERKLPEFKEPISEEFAEELLYSDVKFAENSVNEYVLVPLTQGQFDALVSLVFNWGASNFSLSKGLRKLNAKDYDAASIEFFDKEKGVVKVNSKTIKGLVTRRQNELDLWNDKETKQIVSDSIIKKEPNKHSILFYAFTTIFVLVASGLVIYLVS